MAEELRRGASRGADPAALRRSRVPRLTFHGSVLVMTVAVLLLMAVPPARQLYSQRTDIEAAEKRLETLQRDNAELDRHLARLEDPDYLEKLARKELGLVRPGEIGYVVVPGEPAPKKKEAAPAPADPWYERFLRSLRELVS
jgi:cell division protein FtsB